MNDCYDMRDDGIWFGVGAGRLLWGVVAMMDFEFQPARDTHILLAGFGIGLPTSRGSCLLCILWMFGKFGC